MNEKEIHLRYEDIVPYLPPDPDDVDKDPIVQKYVRDWKEKTQRRYVSRVNSLYDQFKAIWPSGTPIDYYIAYVHFSSKSEDELFDKLQDPETIKEILKIVSLKKSGKKTSNSDNPISEPVNNIENDESSEELYEENTQSDKNKRKKCSRWSETEISSFIKLLSKKNCLKTWKNVSQNFKNKTKEDCFNLYQELHSKGQLSSKYVPKKDVNIKDVNSKNVNSNESDFSNIKGLFLEFNDQHSIVGPQLQSRKELARYSPLYGHTDLITGERMFLPTISEYGTVLDYSSWIRIISSTHLDPIAMEPIRHNRQITIITNENYSEIQSQIKHIGDKKSIE